MIKKHILIIIVMLILLNIITVIFIGLTNIVTRKTIFPSSQTEEIILKVKEHFKIDYDIYKIRFTYGIPDGYYLDVYDFSGNIEHIFEDNSEESYICSYFDNIKKDKSKYEKYLLIELFIEIILIIYLIVIKYKKV